MIFPSSVTVHSTDLVLLVTGTFTLVYATGLMGISPNVSAPPPSSAAGVFGTAAFFGPLIGGITTVFYIWIAILAFGPVTGGHLNCFLTIATFMIRITSLPRAVLYVSFQLVGAALAGLMLRATYGTRDFKVGGCFLFEDEGATVGGALASKLPESRSSIYANQRTSGVRWMLHDHHTGVWSGYRSEEQGGTRTGVGAFPRRTHCWTARFRSLFWRSRLRWPFDEPRSLLRSLRW